ncbi:MAG: efflux RND transporter periplasmic adaptor subunit [Deltaproteobacteria bacterium]|nr:efflux RND transporter periplasmic adaptor subunit [Deltaproteobacteria bacterium]
MNNHWKLIFVLLPVITGAACCQQNSKEMPEHNKKPPVVQVNVMKTSLPGEMTKYEYSGMATPHQQTQISFQLMGTISKVFVDEGDYVKKGQKLAVIDKSRYLSTLRAAQAMGDQAQDAYNRLKTVNDKGSLPAIKWEEIVSKLQQAQSYIQISRQNVHDCTIYAPADGTVSSRSIEIGTNVSPNLPVITIVDIDTIDIRISVPENEISQIKKGLAGNVHIGALGPRIFAAEVQKIGVSANPLSKTYEVKLEIQNSDYLIKPGMAADVELEISPELTFPLVPLRALQKRESKEPYLFVVNEKTKKVSKRTVVTGSFFKNSISIKKGVRPGEMAVVDGQQKLKENTSVAFRVVN